MTAPKLRECPFCGEPFASSDAGGAFSWSRVRCFCHSCGAKGPGKKTQEAARDAWNTRPSPWVAVSERLPKLTEENYECAEVVATVLYDDGLITVERTAYMGNEEGDRFWECEWDCKPEGEPYRSNKTVLAWQPLPAPFRPSPGQQQEKETLC